MNVILLGAGRGQRLMPLTATEPKSFARIGGRRILDWTLDAFNENGLDRFVFVGGYLIEMVRAQYPTFRFAENTAWPKNNILFSLMCAREYLQDGFYSTYTDTLFRGDAVEKLQRSPHAITTVIDTLWRERYRYRSQHPESDGEKVVATGDRVVSMSRDIPSDQATGEFTGVLKMTAQGAASFIDFHDKLNDDLGPEGDFAGGRPFRMAYLIPVLDLMIREGIPVHCVSVPGEYHEVDTLQDYELTQREWGPSTATGHEPS